jgi:arsenite methyltransferase
MTEAARPAPDAEELAEELKACCAATYSSDLVALLLGDTYLPGGRALTRRLADAVEIGPGHRVLDVATGRGTSALLFAGQYGATVTGVDLSAANVSLASGVARSAGLAARATFQVGDAERLPVPDGSVDAVICECALCTFPDKPSAAREFARVLRPGGRVGITDVTAIPDRLPVELTGLGAWIACVADARPATGRDGYADLLEAAGLRVTTVEALGVAMARMIDQIEARLQFVRLTARDRMAAFGIEPGRAATVLAAARRAVADGTLGYGLIVARKPADHDPTGGQP